MKALRNGLFFALIAMSFAARSAVWVNQNAWSPDEEANYSQWVRTNWNVKFFKAQTIGTDPNPFYNLRVDCADTVYSMRFVYSYLRRLPFAVQDPTGGDRLISNDMSRYDSLDGEDQRARAMIKMLYGVTSTDTLANDTYPTAISRSTIRAGSLILTTHANHHSWTIKQILDVGVPWLIFNSRVGAASSVVLQERKSWPNGAWVFEGDHTVKGRAGFRDWRPIEYIGTSVWQVPGFSDEQYQIAAADWASDSQRKLALRAEGINEKLRRLSDAACADLKQRVSGVAEGVRFLRQSQYACMSAADFDQYSTPSRDHRLFDSLADLRRAYVRIVRKGLKLQPNLQAQMGKLFPLARATARTESEQAISALGVDHNSLCVVEYASGQKMDLAEAKRRDFAGLFSSNPLDDLDVRWGDATASATKCKIWDLWTPNVDEAD